ncbi:MAG: hypothetical protein RhofKO_37080 [Rhodothermales bacterium]
MSRVVLTSLILVTLGVGLAACSDEPAASDGETVVYRTVDGLALHADVFRPDTAHATPVILWLHPGGLIFGQRDMLREVQRDLYLKQGFSVVAADYRLAPEASLEEITSDVEAAYQWIRGAGAERYRFDTSRVAVVGHSAGAYLALILGASAVPSPGAVVSFYGYGEVVTPWYQRPAQVYMRGPIITRQAAFGAIQDTPLSGSHASERVNLYGYLRQRGRWSEIVGRIDPVQEPEAVRAFEPLHHIDATYPPTLLLHGTNDGDVPFSASERLAEAFEQQDVPYRFSQKLRVGHVFDARLSPGETEALFAEVFAFLDAAFADTLRSP